MKYLAIKNWEDFQSTRKGWDWIKDYVNQSDDEALASLSFYERGLLQELRRVRGRTGKNIHNDVTHIALATHAKPTDRAHIRHAVSTLVSRGLLVLTNQPVDSLDRDRDREGEGDRDVSATPETITVRIPLKTPEPKKDFTPDDLTFMVLREIGIPARNPELTTLVASALEAKARSPDWTVDKAALHFIERGTAYKSSWVWNSKFKKSWKSWFQDECYDQDPSAWANPQNGNGKSKLQESLDDIDKIQL